MNKPIINEQCLRQMFEEGYPVKEISKFMEVNQYYIIKKINELKLKRDSYKRNRRNSDEKRNYVLMTDETHPFEEEIKTRLWP